MSLLTFHEPVRVTFHGGRWDGLEMALLEAYDRVRIIQEVDGVHIINPILAPAAFKVGEFEYYLRVRNEPPLNYIAIEPE